LKNLACSLVGPAVLLALVLVAGRAAADDASPASEARAEANEIVGFELSVARTPEAADCPDAPAVAAALQQVGSDPARRAPEAEEGPLFTQVLFDRDSTGYVAEVRSTGRKTGVRVLRNGASTCAPMAEATTVVLAVLLDLLPEGVNEPAPATVVIAPSSRASAAPAPARPAAAPNRPIAVALGVETGLGAGVFEDVAAGSLGGAVRPSYGRWELGAGALWVPTRSLPYMNGHVKVALLGARLTGCAWVVSFGNRIGFAGCTGVLLTALRGQGDGFDRDFTATRFWPVAEVGLRGRLELSDRLSLRLGVTGLLPLRRLTFSVERLAVAYETPSLGVLAEIGPELRFE
jgi:hypothetical protein